jgi:hypothetical protein
METLFFKLRNKTVVTPLLALMLVLLSASISFVEQTEIHLSFAKLADWSEKSFKGHTVYSHAQDGNKTVLQAVAIGSASALYKKIAVNPIELPIIKWSWKIRHTLPAENPYRKDVDDFAGRVVVIFPGMFFWQYRAVVYVWADKLPIGTVLPSAFGNNIALIVIESGNQHAGVWRQEQRNYVEDYRAFFHTSPPNTMAVAVMTDADNTKAESIAWYDELLLTRERDHQKNVNAVAK